jgi:hypothetical protein
MHLQYWSRVVQVSSTNPIPYASDAMVGRCRSTRRRLDGRDNVITPTLNIPTVITPTIITPTHNTSTVTDNLCYSGAFSNPNAVRDCPFNLKGGWILDI